MHEALLVNIINQCIGAGVIQKEVFATKCIEAGFFDGVDIQTNNSKKKIVNYLNAHSSMSNSNLTNWCKKHNVDMLSVYLTLEKCLLQGAYKFKSRRGTRIYYCRDTSSKQITEDMLCLR